MCSHISTFCCALLKENNAFLSFDVMDYIRNVTLYIHISVSKSEKIANTVKTNLLKDIAKISIIMVINLISYHLHSCAIRNASLF